MGRLKQGQWGGFLSIFFWLAICGCAQAVDLDKPQTVLILGDSLSAGFGLEIEEAYPALLQKKADDLGLAVKIQNEGVSGDTTAGGVARLEWLLQEPVGVLLLELGTNDALRGLPLDSAEENLQQIIDVVRKHSPSVKIVIAGMMLPPNYGEAYAREFKEIFPRIAKKNGATLIPFLLEGVAGNPLLNFPDRLHPNRAGQKVIADTVWKYLEPVLKQ